jgi:hypothetical protein
MKKIILLGISIFSISCSAPKSLYTWDKYDSASYSYLKKSDEKSTENLIKIYEKIIKKQNGTRGMVPPGLYADYAFVLIQSNKIEEGKLMLQKEVELYPESKVFIDRIFKMLE